MTNLKGPPATSKARPTTSEGAWAFFFSDNADKTTTVLLTLAAHARRGLIMLVCVEVLSNQTNNRRLLWNVFNRFDH